MNILVIGAGARESAIGWALAKSPHVTNLFFSPGNSGTVHYGENLPLNRGRPEGLVTLAKEKGVNLVVMGRFTYIQEGIGELFREAGIPVFGPSLAAAEIENSKSFSKKLLCDLQIPTAKSVVVRDMESAQKFLQSSSYPLVMKTDGPVSGIGVEIVYNEEHAKKFLDTCFVERKFQLHGETIIIEEFLEGVEFSAHAFCDGKTAVMMPLSQDHKRLFDGDTGPNTGGIGAVAPILKSNQSLLDDIKSKAIEPILAALYEQGCPFIGVMYPNIILTKEGWKILEVNARFGDPEAVCYMRLLKTDFYEIILSCLQGTLHSLSVEWLEGYACSVVLTTPNYYEGPYDQFGSISGLPDIDPQDNSTIIFHAETALQNGQPIIIGPRVACISSVASTLEQAIQFAYKKVETVSFNGKYYRKDVGVKALAL